MKRARTVGDLIARGITPSEPPPLTALLARREQDVRDGTLGALAALSEKRYLTSREAAFYLGLPSVEALKKRVHRGTIPAHCWTRMGGRSLRFLRAELDEWLRPAAVQEVARAFPHARPSRRLRLASVAGRPR